MSQPANYGMRTVGPASMPELAGDANDAFQAVLSSHKGSGVPGYKVTGTEYLVDATNPWVKSVWDGSQGLPIYSMDATAHKLFLGNGQIAFPATQNPSSDPNVLDDYEEGTFVPGYVFSTTNGSLAYGTRAGAYTKKGRETTYMFTLPLTSKAGASGVPFINGFPFSNVFGFGIVVINLYADTTGLSAGGIQGRFDGGNTIRLFQPSATGSVNISDANYTNTTTLWGGGIIFS